MGGSKPDFVLRCGDPNVPAMAIFCDGERFHASTQHNRLADDAAKRQVLRGLGMFVLAFSWGDLDGAEHADPPWFDESAAPIVMAAPGMNLKPAHIDLMRGGPMDLLVSWIQSPDPDGLRDLGRALPLLLAFRAQRHGAVAADAGLDATALGLLDGQGFALSGTSAWAWHLGALVAIARRIPGTPDTGVALVLDDADAAVETGISEAWRTWLHLSNLLGLRSAATQVTVRSLVAGASASAPEIASAAGRRADRWRLAGGHRAGHRAGAAVPRGARAGRRARARVRSRDRRHPVGAELAGPEDHRRRGPRRRGARRPRRARLDRRGHARPRRPRRTEGRRQLMAIVIYAPHKAGHHDGSIAKQTHAFIRKLFEDDTLPGLHIEPIKSSADPRVRTGRVTDMYRAVLFKVQASGGQPHYIFTGVWAHDEAIKVASKAVLKLNPVNGLPELIMASEAALSAPAPGPRAVVRPHDAPPAEVARIPLLASASAGVSLERLTDELGIDPELAAQAMLATSDDEIMALAETAIPWQGLALLDLAAGQTVDEVLRKLGLDEPGPVRTGDDDEQLLESLRSPVARMQFAWLEPNEELRQVIEGGDFAKWRTFLHPEQRRYAESSYNGPFRLSGGAGTGKTVVLLHRARMLALREPAARVVLTTFTRNLADSLERDMRLLDGSLTHADTLGEAGLFVTGVDAAAGKVLGAASAEDRGAAVEAVLGVGGNRATGRADTQGAWRDAIASVGSALPVELRSPAFFEAEYASVVLPNRVTTRDAYLAIRRPGRRVALGRNQRRVVWEVISAYRSSAAVQGTVDFGEVCAIAAELGNAQAERVADHVLVDEGQDLTPAQWQFLRSLVAEGPDDMFIADDSQQRIYGQPVVLGRCGIRIVGRSRRLSLNYRTTEQVLRFASSVLAGIEYVDLDDEVTDDAGYRSARSGPPPTRLPVASLNDELDRAAEHVGAWLAAGVQPDAIGILARDQRTVDVVARGFEDRGVSVRQVTRSAATGKHPQLMTMHRAKGMEFSSVLIFGVDAELVPAAYLLRSLPEGERPDLLQRERSLFYVAATRARDELVVMWEGEGSEFLPSSDGDPGGVSSRTDAGDLIASPNHRLIRIASSAGDSGFGRGGRPLRIKETRRGRPGQRFA